MSSTLDHLPIVCTLDIQTQQTTLQEFCVKLPFWHKANTEALSDYNSDTNIDLEKLINTNINDTLIDIYPQFGKVYSLF